MISLLYLKEPLKLEEDIHIKTLDTVWRNCSEAKPHFYLLLGALLVNKKSQEWLSSNQNEKTKTLVAQIKNSIENNIMKSLNYQVYLFMIISAHEKDFIRSEKIHLDLYNKLKMLVYEDSEILDLFTKVIQNAVLGHKEEEEEMARQLVSDVSLLVKRKDAILQKFYVGILGLEQEIFVNLKGFDVDMTGNKKDSMLPTKILNKSQVKMLSDKINKKIKFNLVVEVEGSLKNSLYNTVYGAINSSQFLMMIKVKLQSGKSGCVGLYSCGKSFRTDEDSYCWEDSINYEKGSFLFCINDGVVKYYETPEPGQHMFSLTGGEE